jgi:catechol 2,3-dioxygenase-like lactoylglutathione lyase family enzyme
MNTHSPMIIHYVHDMDRAYAFYNETLGLAPDTRSAGWSTLRCGDTLVALHSVVLASVVVQNDRDRPRRSYLLRTVFHSKKLLL